MTRPSVAGTKLSNSRSSEGSSRTACGYSVCLDDGCCESTVSDVSPKVGLAFLTAFGAKKASRVLGRFDMPGDDDFDVDEVSKVNEPKLVWEGAF